MNQYGLTLVWFYVAILLNAIFILLCNCRMPRGSGKGKCQWTHHYWQWTSWWWHGMWVTQLLEFLYFFQEILYFTCYVLYFFYIVAGGIRAPHKEISDESVDIDVNDVSHPLKLSLSPPICILQEDCIVKEASRLDAMMLSGSPNYEVCLC